MPNQETWRSGVKAQPLALHLAGVAQQKGHQGVGQFVHRKADRQRRHQQQGGTRLAAKFRKSAHQVRRPLSPAGRGTGKRYRWPRGAPGVLLTKDAHVQGIGRPARRRAAGAGPCPASHSRLSSSRMLRSSSSSGPTMTISTVNGVLAGRQVHRHVHASPVQGIDPHALDRGPRMLAPARDRQQKGSETSVLLQARWYSTTHSIIPCPVAAIKSQAGENSTAVKQVEQSAPGGNG